MQLVGHRCNHPHYAQAPAHLPGQTQDVSGVQHVHTTDVHDQQDPKSPQAHMLQDHSVSAMQW